MNVLIYLVPLALLLGLLGLVGFMWALNRGQFEDLEGASWRAISDDDLGPPRVAQAVPAKAGPSRPSATHREGDRP